MKPKLRLNYNNTMLRVCVDRVEGGVISGRVFSQRLKDVLVFPDLSSLVVRLDLLMDEQNYPQAFQRKRSFGGAKQPPKTAADAGKDVREEEDSRPYMDEETVARAAGEKATFVLQILSRRNTNWQGFVEFPDGKGKREFESELDFFTMVNAFLQ
jgi:hypothetical protein